MPFDLSSCTLATLPGVLSVNEPMDVVHRLLELLPVKYLAKPEQRKEASLPEDLIVTIVRAARSLIASEPHVVHVAPPVVICGDLHGQYYDLVNILCRRPPCGTEVFARFAEERTTRIRNQQQQQQQTAEPPTKRPRTEGEGSAGGAEGTLSHSKRSDNSAPIHRYVFLGDYVDRGVRGVEVVVTLLALKLLAPKDVVLLRGNHEDEHVASLYGFFDECKRRYSLRLFKVFCDLFRCLPFAAVVGESIFCVHGGISPSMKLLSDIPDVRPCNVPHDGLLCDLLWADPEVTVYSSDGLFAPSPRNVSYVFSAKALTNFLEANDLDVVVRAHQVVEEGYQFFPPNTHHQPSSRKLVTIFGATNYCDEFQNRGAIMEVMEDMTVSILSIEPPNREQQQLLRELRDPYLCR